MKLDFSQAITTYEFIAIFLAILSLAIPFIKWVWKTIFLRLKLTYIPQDNIITIIFNESGPYVSTGISLHCENKSILLKNIRIVVTRIADQAQLSLLWSNLQSPTTQQVTGGGIIVVNDYARAMKIEANTLPLFMAEFSNTNADVKIKLDTIHAKKMDCMQGANTFNEPYEDAVARFKQQEGYEAFCRDILEEMYWRKGEYEFEIISIYDNDDKEYKKKYCFELSQEDYVNIKENVEQSLLCRLNTSYSKSSGLKVLRLKYRESER